MPRRRCQDGGLFFFCSSGAFPPPACAGLAAFSLNHALKLFRVVL